MMLLTGSALFWLRTTLTHAFFRPATRERVADPLASR